MESTLEKPSKIEALRDALTEHEEFVGQADIVDFMGAEAITLAYIRSLQQIADRLDAFEGPDLRVLTPEDAKVIWRGMEMVGRALFVQQYVLAFALGVKRPARHLLHQTFTNDMINRIKNHVAEC